MGGPGVLLDDPRFFRVYAGDDFAPALILLLPKNINYGFFIRLEYFYHFQSILTNNSKHNILLKIQMYVTQT